MTFALLFPITFACFEEETQPPGQTALSIEPTQLLTDANRHLRTHLMGAEAVALDLEGVELLNGLIPFGDGEAICVGTDCPEPEDGDAEEIADDIATHLLTADRIESSTDTELVLLLDAEFCRSIDETPDLECIAVLETTPVRFVLRSYRAGDVSIDVLVGSEPTSVGQLELFESHLASEIDLAQAKTFVEQVASLTEADEDLEMLANAQLAGRVRGELRRDGAQQYRVSGSVVAPIAFSMPFEDETFEVNIQRALPLFSAQLDAASRSVSFEARTDGASVQIPTAMITDEEEICEVIDGNLVCETTSESILQDGVLSVTWPGSSMSLLIDESDTMSGTIETTGPAQVAFNNFDLFSFDLSAGTQRRIDYDVQATEDGLRLAVAPEMKGVIDMSLAALFPVEMQAEMPQWMSSETLTYGLDGAAQPSLLIGFEEASGVVAEVESGRWHMQSRALNQQVEIMAGQCLGMVESVETDGPVHPLETLQAVACQ